jgi:hypothetical protein
VAMAGVPPRVKSRLDSPRMMAHIAIGTNQSH